MNACALCPRKNMCIPPDGPNQRGGLLFIGEAPGLQEDKNARRYPPGIPFMGKTGEEVNRHYLPLAKLYRSKVTFHNAISCLPDTPQGKLKGDDAKHIALLHECARTNLYPLIQRMKPRVIVPMGGFACRAIFGDGFDLETLHGLPLESPYGTAFPMYHPALGIHEPKKMLYIRTDWDDLRKFLDGSLHIPEDKYPDPDYAEVTDVEEVYSLDPTKAIAGDTEYSKQLGPYCLTYSQAAGTGRLIRAERTDLLDAFQEMLDIWDADILFHSWLGADWAITEAMGLTFPARRMVDTMVRVYHLGNLPQGLKALSRRLLGMEMQDFDDVVTPHSREEVIRYLRLAYAEDWAKPEPQLIRGGNGKWKVYKAHSLKTKLKTFFTDLKKKETDKDVFKAWENWTEEHAVIEAAIGQWPGKDIRHAPFEETLYYACRDADALFRLWPLLKRMSRYVRKHPQEKWRELAA